MEYSRDPPCDTREYSMIDSRKEHRYLHSSWVIRRLAMVSPPAISASR